MKIGERGRRLPAGLTPPSVRGRAMSAVHVRRRPQVATVVAVSAQAGIVCALGAVAVVASLWAPELPDRRTVAGPVRAAAPGPATARPQPHSDPLTPRSIHPTGSLVTVSGEGPGHRRRGAAVLGRGRARRRRRSRRFCPGGRDHAARPAKLGGEPRLRATASRLPLGAGQLPGDPRQPRDHRRALRAAADAEGLFLPSGRARGAQRRALGARRLGLRPRPHGLSPLLGQPRGRSRSGGAPPPVPRPRSCRAGDDAQTEGVEACRPNPWPLEEETGG